MAVVFHRYDLMTYSVHDLDMVPDDWYNKEDLYVANVSFKIGGKPVKGEVLFCSGESCSDLVQLSDSFQLGRKECEAKCAELTLLTPQEMVMDVDVAQCSGCQILMVRLDELEARVNELKESIAVIDNAVLGTVRLTVPIRPTLIISSRLLPSSSARSRCRRT